MFEIKNSANLIIRLDGPAVTDGIDLFELAPALLAIGSTIKEANRAIDPFNKEIGVNVRPFEKGSFIVDISLFAKDNLQNLLQLANDTSSIQIKTLLEWIGIISSSSFGLVQLIKWLKAKPPKQIEKLSSGEIKYTNYIDETVIVNVNIDKLYQNEIIHQNFYTGFGKLLETEGIEKFDTYLNTDEISKVTNTKEDIKSFKSYSLDELRVSVDQESEKESETYLNFKRGSYEGLSDNWSFKIGSSTITATIRDVKFLEQVKKGEVRPYARDLLKVKLKERTRVKGTEVLNPTYEVVEVLEYTPSERNQNQSLFE